MVLEADGRKSSPALRQRRERAGKSKAEGRQEGQKREKAGNTNAEGQLREKAKASGRAVGLVRTWSAIWWSRDDLSYTGGAALWFLNL
jgi:hypothetical protein